METKERDGYLNIVVNGVPYEIDIDDELVIDDIDHDMKTVAAEVAFWGAIQAGAEEEKIRADAYYRHWRANIGEKLLEGEPRLAEWKVKQKVESMEQFEVLKAALATATKNVVLAKSMFQAFCKKANMIQSKGAMVRQELDSDDLSVRSQVDDRDKIEVMKSSFKKRSKK